MVCRVVDYAMRLEAGLWASSRKGGSVRGSCILCPGKAACCPRRRHRHHPLQIPWRTAQRSAPLRPCPGSRRLSSRGWWRLLHVLHQRMGAGLVAGPLNKALFFVAPKLSTTPALASQKTLTHSVKAWYLRVYFSQHQHTCVQAKRLQRIVICNCVKKVR